MIVSLHVTHVSVGNVDGLNEVIPELEKNVNLRIGTLEFVKEYVVVRTCNRFEVYVATYDNEKTKNMLNYIVKMSVPYTADEKFSFILQDGDCVKHLFRVICGLDSLIVGEDQIQHQIRESYIQARKENHANGTLAYVFDHALTVGKRVRSETALNKGAVSVGSAAVELAEQKIGKLEGKTVTIFGAGDMASVIAKNLVGKGPKTVFVSNRTFDHAKELAGQLGGTAITMNRMNEAIRESDLVLVAISAPHVVIRRSNVEEAMTGRTRKLLMIDVSVPRNIAEDVLEVHDVEVDTMDSLQSIAMENVARRTNEISEAEHIITEELMKIDKEEKEKAANEVIRAISIKLAQIREEELTQAKIRALAQCDIDCVLEDFSRALINNITSEMFVRLREASREGHTDIFNAATTIFGLEDERDDVS